MNVPLCVDLDGTLIQTDMLHESTLRAVRDRPLDLLRIPLWLARGRAVLKRALSDRVDFDAASLPYNESLLNWLREERAAGRRLILCTASDQRFAQAIGEHLGVFDEVIASDGLRNVAGHEKAQVLIERFGERGFDYAGNSGTDLKVWAHARRAVVVNGAPALASEAREHCEVEREFPRARVGLSVWRRTLRSHQWLKNALLFVPLLAAHQLTNVRAIETLLLAFVSFSLCASSVYIANDLLDLESDRQHPRKRARPFAAGLLPAWVGVALAPVLLAVSVVLAWVVGKAFLGWLLAYFAVTVAYSWGLKRVVLIDCLTLACLYTLRIVAGGAAAGLSNSFWMLAFSVFLFLSLAFVKRYAEIQTQIQLGGRKLHGRGYYDTDLGLIQTLGVTSGFAAVLVLALYLNSDAVVRLYHAPQWMWGAVPVMLYWISWVWLQAHRGNMNDDPLVFAVKDKASLAAGVLFLLVLVLGAAG
jgi:4-hydroxybenzoate polyprenyltransferase/phosphoserine phosphatase